MTDYIQWIPANEGLALQKAHTRSAKETALPKVVATQPILTHEWQNKWTRKSTIPSVVTELQVQQVRRRWHPARHMLLGS